MKSVLLIFLLSLSSISFAQKQRVFFENLKNGDQVSSPVKVKMGVEGYEVKAAGSSGKHQGHHHIIINGGPIETGKVIPPNDAKHQHFGKGQMETELALPKGEHTLTLQFADGAHRSFGPEASATIKITVK